MEIVNKAILEPILLVEDDMDHARLVIKAFTEHGRMMNKIVWVKNGVEAMDYINRTGVYINKDTPRPGLILLDIKMPLKNGFEVLSELKADERYQTIPVVMLTTTNNSEDADKALKMGANDYIVKPVRFSDFVQKVSQLGHYWAFVSDAYLVNCGQ